MKSIVKFLDRLEEVILILMFAGMVLIIFFQVIMRYGFNNSLSWSEELGKFLFVWLSWLGISIGAKRGEHIKITMLIDKLPFIKAHVLNIISEIIVMIICAITTYYGIILVIKQINVNYAGIKISMAWGYLAVVTGCCTMILRNISSIVVSIKKINSYKNKRKGGNA